MSTGSQQQSLSLRTLTPELRGDPDHLTAV